ncbi:hypothetical protein CDL12_02091 [Handroanthus impetiginosus]|uniref:TF-B3 domain-containing protein n=1 Tax=Handroanthus impetiginosus TaxID=429701 RepID=A0A2G9I5Y1_9LAMI|nr:hypothetical protein CDL12_02091 [Handroanthus impetiginosus]
MEPLLQQSVERGVRDQQNSKLAEKSEAAESDEDSIRYLTSETFFDMVLAKSHVQQSFQLQLPARIVRELPKATVPVVLRYNCKNWNLSYIGNCKAPRFDTGWRNFVNDNNLKSGDACVFELKECSPENIRFKVHILRGDLPPELAAAVETHGTKDNPIDVD